MASSTDEKMGVSVHNCHKCLSMVLASCKKAQQESKPFYLRLGSCVHHCDLQFPLAFVIGDAKSQDMLCGRFAGSKTKQMPRECLTPCQCCSDPDHQCKFFDVAVMEWHSELASKQFEKDGDNVNTDNDPVNIKMQMEAELKAQRKKHHNLLHSMSQH